jgi:hypothetical protein
LTADRPLVLEGLEFREIAARLRTSIGGVVRGHGPLYVANCRFVLGGYPGLTGLQAIRPSPVCEIRNCQFVCDRQATLANWVGNLGGRLLLENNVLLAPPNTSDLYPWGWLASLVYAKEASIRLANNSLVGRSLFFTRILEPSGEPKPVVPVVRVEATGNVLDAAGPLLWLRSEKPFSWEEMQTLVRGATAWQERRNVHGEGCTYLGLNLQLNEAGSRPRFENRPPPRAFRGPGDWEQFWGARDTGSLQGPLRYRGGDLLARVAADPAAVPPEDCRLAAGSAGKGAGEGGRDLGADVDLVGPGPAYERWKQTPAYRQWLGDTGQGKDR